MKGFAAAVAVFACLIAGINAAYVSRQDGALNEKKKLLLSLHSGMLAEEVEKA